MLNQKSIAPIVATSLLLVLSILSVITFQVWFTSFSDSFLVNTEKTSSLEQIRIEHLSSNILYINSPDEFSNISVFVNGLPCYQDNLSLEKGINQVQVTSCVDTSVSEIKQIVILSQNSIITNYQYFQSRTNQSLSPPIQDGCHPTNNILRVGESQVFTTFMEAYIASSDGDSIILYPGVYTAPNFNIDKDIKVFGATGNPLDVTIQASLGSSQWFIFRMDLMSPSQVNPGFYHLSLNRNNFAWRHYFTVYGKDSPEDGILTIENVRLTGSLSNMHVTTIEGSYPTIIFNNVDYMSSPYEIMHGGWCHCFADIYINSLYVPGYAVQFYRNSNFNVIVNNHSNNINTHGTSQYNISNAFFPCGFTY